MHHYLECGLSHVYLVNGFPWPDTIGSLHTTIGKLLVQKAGAMDGDEIRFLRREMGMTQAVFGEKLDAFREAVCRWERGRDRIKPDKDVSLRKLYLEFVGCPCSIELLSRVMSVNDQDDGVIIMERHHHQWYLSPRKKFVTFPRVNYCQ